MGVVVAAEDGHGGKIRLPGGGGAREVIEYFYRPYIGFLGRKTSAIEPNERTKSTFIYFIIIIVRTAGIQHASSCSLLAKPSAQFLIYSFFFAVFANVHLRWKLYYDIPQR